MKKGFTLLELLIASLLLSMLVTILTQLFSQSSIAWRTGEAGVAELDNMRSDISAIQRDADNAILVKDRNGNLQTRRLTGIWDKDNPGQLNRRGFEETTRWEFQSFPQNAANLSQCSPRQQWSKIKVSGKGAGGEKIVNYLVGVTSAGPDGQFGTWDDITSWPTDE